MNVSLLSVLQVIMTWATQIMPLCRAVTWFHSAAGAAFRVRV